MLFAVFTLLAVVSAGGSLGLTQGSGDRAIDQAQRAVREQITSREGGRDLMAHFNNDARTEFKSNAEVRVRGTGAFSRNNDGKSRNFSYEAVVNNRNRNVSDIRYDWRGDWYSSGGVGNYGGQLIYCASDDMRRHTCPINTSGGVRLAHQKSGSACVQGRTWGFNRNSIWVDRGCRGDFEVGRGSSGSSYVTSSRLTGTYRLNQSRSDNPATVADRVARNLPGGDQQRLRNSVMRRLEAPESLAIERRGRTITISSSRAAQVTFEADGHEQTEQSRNGRSIRTKATLTGERLVVSSEGDRSIDYQVIFEPIDNGRSLRVTRRIADEGLQQQVVANSVYEKTSDVAQLDIYPGARDDYPPAGASRGNFLVPDGTQLVAVLNDNLSTKQAHEGDRFTLTLRSPSQYDGASIEGHLVKVNRSGQISGRAEMSLEFDRIRLRDGRASNFAGYIESVRTTSGETVRVDNEGRVQDEGGQTGRTVTRAGIGAAVGAVIGAIVGGGKGAAIGAAVGAGTGAGSVFIQGRDDLDLTSGTEFTIRASAPR
jgi:Protein of unknown function (DUF3011)/YMGG-like Gly-zipper